MCFSEEALGSRRVAVKFDAFLLIGAALLWGCFNEVNGDRCPLDPFVYNRVARNLRKKRSLLVGSIRSSLPSTKARDASQRVETGDSLSLTGARAMISTIKAIILEILSS